MIDMPISGRERWIQRTEILVSDRWVKCVGSRRAATKGFVKVVLGGDRLCMESEISV
jgi:hypothetical protein